MTAKTRVSILFISVLLALVMGIAALAFGNQAQREVGGGIVSLSALVLIIFTPVFFDD